MYGIGIICRYINCFLKMKELSKNEVRGNSHKIVKKCKKVTNK